MTTLSPRAEALIAEQVASGNFASADAFVDEALGLIAWVEAGKAEERAWLDRKLALAVEAADRGEFVDGPQFFADLERELLDQTHVATAAE